MRRYLFVIEVDPVDEDRTYTRLPIHCTLMHWFLSPMSPEKLVEKCADAFKNALPIELVSQASEMFGREHNIPVHSIILSEALRKLHMQLFDALNTTTIGYTEPGYVGRGYRPHVTVRGDHSLPIGSQKKAERVYLAEAIDENNPPSKKIRAVIRLS